MLKKFKLLNRNKFFASLTLQKTLPTTQRGSFHSKGWFPSLASSKNFMAVNHKILLKPKNILKGLAASAAALPQVAKPHPKSRLDKNILCRPFGTPLPSLPLQVTKSLLSSRFLQHYKQIISPDILLQYPLENIMQTPFIEKIVLNCSSKVVVQDKKAALPALLALEWICGQKSQKTWARKSIAAFKLREKSLLGCKVTLRNAHMFCFLEKWITVVLPKIQYSHEYKKSGLHPFLDKYGNYNVGIPDPFLFTELEAYFEIFQSLRGFNLIVVTSSPEKKKNSLFLNSLQIPCCY